MFQLGKLLKWFRANLVLSGYGLNLANLLASSRSSTTSSLHETHIELYRFGLKRITVQNLA